MKKIIHLELELYHYNIIVSLIDDESDYNNTLDEISKYAIIPDDKREEVLQHIKLVGTNEGRTIEFHNTNLITIILKNENVNKVNFIENLVHEILHTTIIIFDNLNQPIENNKTDELFAYLNQFIVEKILNELYN